MIFAVVCVVIGLFHVTTAEEFCRSDTSQARTDDQYFELTVDIPRVGTYSLNTFKKNTPYRGTFAAKVALHSVIVQARTFSGRHYGNFFELSPGVFEIQKCVTPDDTMIGRELQPTTTTTTTTRPPYDFAWMSEAYSAGDIQFWVGIKLQEDQDYFWVEGPQFRASTDYDSNDQEPTGESTTHKIYYIVVPSVFLVLMIVMVGGSMMAFSKVKYGTVCCCSEWRTPISYRYARKYSMRRRQNPRNDAESAREQPPSYDNAVKEEDKIARQNVARYEREAYDTEDVTDDHAPLTGP